MRGEKVKEIRFKRAVGSKLATCVKSVRILLVPQSKDEHILRHRVDPMRQAWNLLDAFSFSPPSPHFMFFL